jgi:hypothetical protein
MSHALLYHVLIQWGELYDMKILKWKCELEGISLKTPVILNIRSSFNLNVLLTGFSDPKYFFAFDSDIIAVLGSSRQFSGFPAIT